MNNKKTPLPDKEMCPRCAGTGLICGHEPIILSGACCVDYANAICPDCKGTGKMPPPGGNTDACGEH